jgi:hypothetical protein
MKILIPSYHKTGRPISNIYNRPEAYFFIRPSQEGWYRTEFPLANLMPVIDDSVEVGQIGLAVARQKILEWWRINHGDEEWAFEPDDDVYEFWANDTSKGKKYKITIDKAFERIIAEADNNTTIIGPTHSDLVNFHTPEVIKENQGESPEGCCCISCNAIGNYITDINTFENQYFAGLQVANNKKFRVVSKIKFVSLKDVKYSINFNKATNQQKSKTFCENTINNLPAGLLDLKLTKQGTYRVDFNKKWINTGFNIGIKKFNT